MTKDQCRAAELASALRDAIVTASYGNAHWVLSKEDVLLLRAALKQYAYASDAKTPDTKE